MKSLTACLMLMIAAGREAAPDATERGRALSAWSSPASIEKLIAAASPELRAAIATAGGPAVMAEMIARQLGAERQVLDEFAITLNGLTSYHRLSAFERAPAALTSVVWNSAGIVEGATVRPAPRPHEDASARTLATKLSLPFAQPRQGKWFTYWGGANAARNYHVAAPDQRYAYDFVVVRGGRSFDGRAEDPDSYFCWSEPVLAPAPGLVTTAIDGIADNRPVGAMNPRQAAGNHVVIEHGPGVYSLIAHLQAGSVAVADGQRVRRGQKLGLCGNSGNSSEPHVHYHLQTTGSFGGDAKGLPAPFTDLLVDGRRAGLAVPVRGQTVAPAR